MPIASPNAVQTALSSIEVTSSQGRELDEDFEGLFLRAYRDSVGVLTIGYGHTNLAGVPPRVVPGMTITKEQADAILSADLLAVDKNVDTIFNGITLKQFQHDALSSFDFNTGDLAKSSIPRLIRAARLNDAANVLLLYNHAGGRVLRGLTRRRNAERLMFLGNVDGALRLAKG